MTEFSKRNKMKAGLAAAIIIAAAFCIVATTDDEFVEEADAIAPALVLILALVATFVVGLAAGLVLGMFLGDPAVGQEQAYRQGEANLVAQSILQGIAYYLNSTDQLVEILKLTIEHFIRYAELTAAFVWEPDKQYNANEILEGSRAYHNAAMAISNSSAQTSQLFHQISERLGIWNDTTTTNAYANKMTVAWNYGTQTLPSNSHFDGELTTVVQNATLGQKVYISNAGPMWVFGGSATLISSTGTNVTLAAGKNNMAGFTPGIYTLQAGRSYAGPMTYLIDPNAAPIRPGIVMEAGTQTKLAVYNPSTDKVTIDGNDYSSFGLTVTPDGGTPQPPTPASLLPMFRNLNKVITQMNTNLMSANSAASAVWNLYTIAGEASAFITTLIVPDNYQTININAAQKSLITAVAMVQLGNFMTAHKEQIDAEDFQLTSDSLTLFCRGDIYNKEGKLLYQNAIFTPLFYTQDVDLVKGDNLTTQPAMICIWAYDTTLSSWNFTSSTKVGEVPPLATGGTIYIYEMKLGNNFVDTAHLEIREIHLVKAQGWDQVRPPVPEPPADPEVFWALVMIILGLLVIVVSVLIKPLRPLMYLGILLMILGGGWYIMSSFSIWSMIGLFTFPAVMPKGTGGSGKLFDRAGGGL